MRMIKWLVFVFIISPSVVFAESPKCFETSTLNYSIERKRVVLQQNIVKGVNTITQAMLYVGGADDKGANTVFIIQDNYTLNSNINIPNNCILEFDGGSISGKHSLKFANTELSGRVVLDVNCEGTITNKRGFISWFKDSSINAHNLGWLLSNCEETDVDRDVVLDAPINLGNHRINVYSSNNSIIKVNCSPAFPYLSEFCSWFYSKDSPSVTVHDITVDFENRNFLIPSPNYVVRIANLFFVVSAKFCDFHNVCIKNYGKSVKNQKADSFVGIAIRSNGLYTVNLHDIIFENIIVVGDGRIGGSYAGMGGCISVTDINDSNQQASPVRINNISCKNCYSINTAGNPFKDDFDCIYIGASDKNERLSECSITNCYFENINKRGIKICCQNVSIDNVYYVNPGKIEGMAALIDPQSTNCTIKNVYAYPTTDCSLIISTITRQFTVSDCVIIPSSGDLKVRAISGCTEIRNCFFKNCYNPIVCSYSQEINDMIPGKFHGYRMESEALQYDNVINCVFENCKIIYDQLFSSIRTNACFKDCMLYNCLRFNTSETFIADNCRFVRSSNSGIKGAFVEMRTWNCFLDNNPSKKNLNSSTTYNIKVVLKNCFFDAGNMASHLVSSHLTDNNPLQVNVDMIIDNCELQNFTSDGVIISGNEGIHFNNLSIQNTYAPIIKLRIQSKWTGVMSIAKSVLDAYYGNSYYRTSKELAVYNSKIDNGKLSLKGVFVSPSYNYINIIFKDMPKEGTLFWQNNRPTWSNGTTWVDSTGKPI